MDETTKDKLAAAIYVKLIDQYVDNEINFNYDDFNKDKGMQNAIRNVADFSLKAVAIFYEQKFKAFK